MGLLFADSSGAGDFQAKAETALLHKLGCQACPLKKEPGRMPATGATRPLVYMLGISPIRGDVERGEHFSGDAGDLVYRWIPKKYKTQIRWNNIVNSWVPKNEAPSNTALECCRPRVIKDIEEAKPKAIFGFGNAPLHWVSGFHGITHWRGRRMPVKVGTHTCWYYAFSDPAELLRFARDNGGDFGSEDERMFMFDMRQAFADLDDLPKPVVHMAEEARANVECITDLRQIEAALRWASQQPAVGLDYETNGIRPYGAGAKILTASVGTIDKAYAFPIGHPGARYTKQQTSDIIDLWKRFLLRAPCVKLVHNLAFELEWSGYFFGTEVIRARPWEDTANAAAIVDERRGKQKPGPFSLEFLVQQYFGINLKNLSNLDRSRLEFTPLEKVLSYNGMDSKYHHGLWLKLWAEIQRLGLDYPYELAARRVPTLTLSQLKGVPVDQERIKVLDKKYGDKIAEAVKTIESLDVIHEFKRRKGRAFKPQSNDDILFVFDDMLKRPEVRVVDKYTKEEKRSTDESVLTQIKHPLSTAILNLREASGTKSKYVNSLSCDAVKYPDTTLWPDGLLHAQFNTFFAETGRLSCIRKGTQVQVPGGSKNIEDVKVGDLVYSFDFNKKLVLRRVLNRWYRGRKKVIRLHWRGHRGNNGYLDVTPDHRVRLSSGVYCPAGDLVQAKRSVQADRTWAGGASILALHRGPVQGGYVGLTVTGYSEKLSEHRFVFEQVNGYLPEHVHHVDDNRANNVPSNLEGRTASSHIREHQKERMTRTEAQRRWGVRSVASKQRTVDALVSGRKQQAASRRVACNNHALCYSKEIPGLYPVYDLEVEGTHNFIAGELCVHNCEWPNLQNFPKRDAGTKEVRTSIRAAPGCHVLAFDYGQIEARVIAMFTKDKRFVKSLWERYDVHFEWAERVAYEYPARIGGKKFLKDKKVMKTFRTDIKNQWTFPLFFGAKDSSVAGYLQIPLNVIKPLVREFWKQFSGVHDWQATQLESYQELGYTETLTGRRRHGPMSVNQIYNSPVQGTAAEIVLDAMCRLSETQDPQLQPEINIHDDLTFLRVPEKDIDVIAEKVIGMMLQVPFKWAHIVPITAEMSLGTNWADIEEIGTYSSDTWMK